MKRLHDDVARSIIISELKSRGLTQRDLEKYTGIAQQHISKGLRGEAWRTEGKVLCAIIFALKWHPIAVDIAINGEQPHLIGIPDFQKFAPKIWDQFLEDIYMLAGHLRSNLHYLEDPYEGTMIQFLSTDQAIEASKRLCSEFLQHEWCTIDEAFQSDLIEQIAHSMKSYLTGALVEKQSQDLSGREAMAQTVLLEMKKRNMSQRALAEICFLSLMQISDCLTLKSKDIWEYQIHHITEALRWRNTTVVIARHANQPQLLLHHKFHVTVDFIYRNLFALDVLFGLGLDEGQERYFQSTAGDLCDSFIRNFITDINHDLDDYERSERILNDMVNGLTGRTLSSDVIPWDNIRIDTNKNAAE